MELKLRRKRTVRLILFNLYLNYKKKKKKKNFPGKKKKKPLAFSIDDVTTVKSFEEQLSGVAKDIAGERVADFASLISGEAPAESVPTLADLLWAGAGVDKAAPTLKPQLIAAPELGYTFGKDSGGSGMNEILHALLHTGNSSNKRKLLLGLGLGRQTFGGANAQQLHRTRQLPALR